MKLETMPAVALLLAGSPKPDKFQQGSQRLSHNKGVVRVGGAPYTFSNLHKEAQSIIKA
jgi:UDP-N-acetylmuramoylalanine-D-glutamate ligase